MNGPPTYGDPQKNISTKQVALGGGVGVGISGYAENALRLLENGYSPLPIQPNTKRPAPSRWTSVTIDERQISAWVQAFPDHGIGLRAGHLIGVDIDVLDPDIAHQVMVLAQRMLGDTLMRVGLWPKRLLLYRTKAPFTKLSTPGLEILGLGQQFVAFGIHPFTGQPYDWPLGETPLDAPLADLPEIALPLAQAFVAEAATLIPGPQRSARVTGRRTTDGSSQLPIRDADGLVTDGRDGWLSMIALHAVWDASEAALPLHTVEIATRVWARFVATTDLSRPQSGSGQVFTDAHAECKVADKARLLAEGRLPLRAAPFALPVSVDPGLPLVEGRSRLDELMAGSCGRIGDWHEGGCKGDPPRIGIRATVGLGKTAVSRRHVVTLMERLKAKSLPYKVLVFTPSHVLAEETATAWRADGVNSAVHRGYEAKHPLHKVAMCKDIDMVRMAIAAGLPAFPNSCLRWGGSKCHAFDLCLKQDNLTEVEKADVVVAPYDTLFTGLSVNLDDVAMLVIDEGCWPRALQETRGISVETLGIVDIPLEARWDDAEAEQRAWDDLFVLRTLAATALLANGPETLASCRLVDVGLSAAACGEAAALEARLRPEPVLRPGLPQGARRHAREISQEANRSIRMQQLFAALARLLEKQAERNGRIRILPPDAKTGLHEVVVTGLKKLNAGFIGKPVLHLDATLRADLAATILPGLEVSEISAAMPHMALTLVQGSFGKTSLCHDPRAAPGENQRRANRLRECVDHVRWQARLVSPGRVLVVTYKDCEAAFAGIPGVEVAHFNAIAGLDIYRDVALLIVIGRPLPPSLSLHPMVGGYFSIEPEGAYEKVVRSVPMRDGTQRTIKVRQHEDPHAEILRAAICDDEIIQAIGRGRGVNRTANNPLQVQVLADVALPMVHDHVMTWDTIVPDIVQRMLLAGIAVDSPADAARLHPMLFETVVAADHAFRRAGFNRYFPLKDIYRGMAVKSARYRLGGRGHGWQRAFWIEGTGCDARQQLEQSLVEFAGWEVL